MQSIGVLNPEIKLEILESRISEYRGALLRFGRKF